MEGDAPLKRILDTAQYNLSKTEELKKDIEKHIEILNKAMGTYAAENDTEA